MEKITLIPDEEKLKEEIKKLEKMLEKATERSRVYRDGGDR